MSTESQAAAPLLQAPERIIDPWLLSVAVLWGMNVIPTKWLLEVMGPAGILLFRYITCAAILSLAVWHLGRRRGRKAARPWGLMLLVGMWVAVQQLMFIYALDWTSASEASLIISIAPIWTALIGGVTRMEAISAGNWAGILAAAAGVALIVAGGGALDTHMPTRVQGDLLMIVSSLGYGSFMVYSKRIMNNNGALRVMSWSFVFGLLLVAPAGMGQLIAADWARFDLLLWASLLYTGLIAGGYGFVVWYRTIARTTAAKTSVYQYLVPVVSLVGAALLLGDRMTAPQVAGALVAMTGLVLARRPTNGGAK